MSKSARAPMVQALIAEINVKISERKISREDFREELNRLLSPERKLPETHSGWAQVTRWLAPASNRWSEPSGEIILAMSKWLDRQP